VTHFWTVLGGVGLGALGIWLLAGLWAVRSQQRRDDAVWRERMLKRGIGRPDRFE